jgi:hypothetical protein
MNQSARFGVDPAILQAPPESVIDQFWSAVTAHDPIALALLVLTLALLVVVLVLVVKICAWILSLLKRFILFLVVLLSLGLFLIKFKEELLAGPVDYTLILVGVIGAIFAVIAFVISLLSLKRHWEETRALRAEACRAVKREGEELEQGTTPDATIAFTPTQVQQPQLFTTQALDTRSIRQSLHDRSLLAVLSYIMVAEFGVFSSVTVAAPNSTVGLWLFAAFMVAAVIFIKTTYHRYMVGIAHLAVSALFGIFLSISLGHLWVGTPLEVLLSLDYFATNSLVAFITGLAVSLFMGSKG